LIRFFILFLLFVTPFNKALAHGFECSFTIYESVRGAPATRNVSSNDPKSMSFTSSIKEISTNEVLKITPANNDKRWSLRKKLRLNGKGVDLLLLVDYMPKIKITEQEVTSNSYTKDSYSFIFSIKEESKETTQKSKVSFYNSEESPSILSLESPDDLNLGSHLFYSFAAICKSSKELRRNLESQKKVSKQITLHNGRENT